MINCYAFDIDGTLADSSRRAHHLAKAPKDWDAFFSDMENDPPIAHMTALAKSVRHGPYGMKIVFITGRPDKYRKVTKAWLNEHVTTCHAPLYMRKTGDHRDDTIVKLELLADLRADGYEPIMVFEDRTRVVQAYREAGVPCMHVAAGDF
jgi:phosphoglycolate phosphatase-like HAD superfamily hydrolase